MSASTAASYGFTGRLVTTDSSATWTRASSRQRLALAAGATPSMSVVNGRRGSREGREFGKGEPETGFRKGTIDVKTTGSQIDSGPVELQAAFFVPRCVVPRGTTSMTLERIGGGSHE